MSLDPGEIKKLDEVVVNRIAAGEIIQRPANALKELIENSLDAKSSFIQVTVKNGGLKLLQIQDNGTGIRKEDLSIVCERFTTSKLRKFEDLSNIATFGFRGEALASISHVAHLTIQTKTAKEICGYKASYENGKLKAPPKACAGNQGTIITIEDLFFNMPQRKQCLKSPNEEFQKISDVLAKYAIHNSKVGFSLKKFGEQQLSIKTPPNASQEQNINTIYGSQIAKELLPIEMKDSVHKFQMKGFLTKANYSAKKGIMLLFINHRLVDSSGLKSAIDGVYSTYLPKGSHPFIYISLDLEPSNLDVNVHPTKHEVHFLHEDEIIEKIKAHIEEKLLGSNETRSFYKQMKLSENKDEELEKSILDKSQKSFLDKTYAKDMIRTDSKEQKLTKYIITYEDPKGVNKSEKSDSGCSEISLSGSLSQGSSLSQNLDESFRVTAARKHKEVQLTSILNMRKKIESNCNVMLRKTLKEMVFVGVVDQTFALFQHETKLFLCNTPKLSEEFFYQRLVYEFQNFPKISLETPLPLKDLLLIALNTEESGWTEEDGDKLDLAESASNILVEKSAIMKEYFSLNINVSGELESLPSLLPKHSPCLTFLPLYLLRLATEVEWDSEEECFETFSRETARFYSLQSQLEMEQSPLKYKWQTEHLIYPAFKKYLLPPTRLRKHLYELTNLPTLYKVFERC